MNILFKTIFFLSCFSFLAHNCLALDSDNDGLSDGEEMQYLINWQEYLSETGYDYQLFPDICGNGTDYIITWVDYGYAPHNGEIAGIIVSADGTAKTNQFLINTSTSTRQDSPAVCSIGGNYLVVWDNHGTENDSMDVFGQLLDSSGNKIGAEFQINTYTPDNQNAPDIAAMGTNYMVVWVSDCRTESDIVRSAKIYGQLFDQNAQKIGSEIQINTSDTRTPQDIFIASNGTRYLVAWTGFDSAIPDYDVHAQILDNEGTKIGSEFRVNDYFTSNQHAPSIACDGHNFMVEWTSRGQDGDEHGIYAKLLDPDGNTIKPEFRINETTTDAQMYPSICFNGTYYFVAWQHGMWVEEAGQAIYNEIHASSFDNEGRIMFHEYNFRISPDSALYSSQERFPVIASNGSDFLFVWGNCDYNYLYEQAYYYVVGLVINPGFGTNPYNADTDSDGLSDGNEIHLFNTDPFHPDSDGDGLSDGDEVYVFDTNPLNGDTDGDFIYDYEEIYIHATMPNSIDSDNDSLADFEEVGILLSDGFESNSFNGMNWSHAGNTSWIILDNDAAEGDFSASSTSIQLDNTSSILRLTLNFPFKSKLSFRYKVSSEEGCDFFKLRINSTVIEEWSGDVPWTLYSLSEPLPVGTNIIEFEYIKDGALY